MMLTFCLLFLSTVLHAPLVLNLTGLSRIARHASAPLVATLFAVVGLLRVRKTRRAQAHEDDDQ
jgi:DMSO/TMAO reductase YedYZ heme-binding membrane subunit